MHIAAAAMELQGVYYAGCTARVIVVVENMCCTLPAALHPIAAQSLTY